MKTDFKRVVRSPYLNIMPLAGIWILEGILFERRETETMAHRIICPRKCTGGYADRIRKLSQRQAGISSRIAQAAKLPRHEQVFTCLHCSAVWFNSFDEVHHGDITVVLGEYDGPDSANSFLPEAWLNKAIEDLR